MLGVILPWIGCYSWRSFP